MQEHPQDNHGSQSSQPSRDTRRFIPTFSSPARRNFKLGKTATKAYNQVIDFLTKDIDTHNFKFSKPNNSTGLSHRKTARLKENKKNEEKEARQLKKLIKRSNDVLATATTVFPFDLFPDTITVDRTKVTIIKRSFIWSQEVMSIRIEDVLNVTSGVGPIFGSLTIASRVMSSEDHFVTKFFWKDDAIHLKHIIQGYVIAQHNNIKTSHLEREELINTLAELGHDTNGRL